MWMTIGERRFAIILADTDAARAFAAQLPLTLGHGRAQRQRKTRRPAADACPPMQTGRERSTTVI